MPAAIIILSIFFLNTFIDTEKEERIEAKDSEEQIRKAFDSMVVTVYFNNGGEKCVEGIQTWGLLEFRRVTEQTLVIGFWKM
ncbi:hypothetical protein V1499_11510 [Neobacillus sp. SCS-31]|uniref:hypothetical protein n=1 Tax=Neobacillus oceani TaxID=3115292 RepID=UPI0039065D86